MKFEPLFAALISAKSSLWYGSGVFLERNISGENDQSNFVTFQLIKEINLTNKNVSNL